jgi:hypothetical protein
MNDLTPMLHQDLDSTPMLGGDRKIELCLACGSKMFRDFFGNSVCLDCAENDRILADLRANPVCPHCGGTDSLAADVTAEDRIVYVFCEGCDNKVWLISNYNLHHVVGMAYLDKYGLEPYDDLPYWK